MRRKLSLLMMGAVLAIPATRMLRADDDDHDHDKKVRRYYDADAHDWHVWNDREDRAWHHYWEERHEAAHDWAKTNAEERRDYWRWRHNHPDAVAVPDPH